MTKLTKLLSLLLCLVLMCSVFAACGDDSGDDSSAPVQETPKTDGGSADSTEEPAKNLPDIWKTATYTENTTIGEGAKTVVVKVEAEGHSVELTVKTDAATLGEALLAHKLIAGEESEYGLYVKTVNGMLADYDVDSTYWGFYQGGEYMMSGVDTTEIKGGEHFELVRTK